jgi:uncharacterized protein
LIIFYLCGLELKMKARKSGVILPFTALDPGFYEFEYLLGKPFFDLIPESLIADGEIRVTAKVQKGPSLMEVDLHLNCLLKITCDRCLAEASLNMPEKARVLVRRSQGGKEENPDAEIILIGPQEDEVDLSMFIYETACLNLPISIIPCEITGDKSLCDQETLSRLADFSIDKGEEEEEED